MISTTTLRAITADLDDARLLRALFLQVAQELPAHADAARVLADTLTMQIDRRERAVAKASIPVLTPECRLLVGEDLWTEMEVRLINAGEVRRLATCPTKSDT